MSDITTKFDKFKEKKTKEFNKSKEFEPLSDDIITLAKMDTGEYQKIDGPIEIIQITGVITDENEIKRLDEIAGGPVINTDLRFKQVKRGQLIWLTCILQKPSSSAVYNTQTIGCISARIVDIFYGLNKLNTIKQ